jgi:hypothetical protein
MAQEAGRIEIQRQTTQQAIHQSLSTQEKGTNCPENRFEIPDLVNPTQDLHNETISALFSHYIERLAAWYDLCEQDRPFESLITVRALEVPVVFNAVIAFSAQHKALNDARYETYSTLYHSACIEGLLGGISSFNPTLQEDYLVAACLLRSYEILGGIVVCLTHTETSLTL